MIPRHAGLTPWVGGWLIFSESTYLQRTLDVTRMTQDRQPSELSLACDANERVGASVLLDSSGRALVTLRGEQDILTVVAARRLLVDAIRLGAGQLIIDLCDVTVVDESVLGLIALGYRHAHRAGGTLSILTEDPLLIRKLRVSGLDRMVPRYAALSEVPGTVS